VGCTANYSCPRGRESEERVAEGDRGDEEGGACSEAHEGSMSAGEGEGVKTASDLLFPEIRHLVQMTLGHLTGLLPFSFMKSAGLS
jgi:hypothetical protein